MWPPSAKPVGVVGCWWGGAGGGGAGGGGVVGRAGWRALLAGETCSWRGMRRDGGGCGALARVVWAKSARGGGYCAAPAWLGGGNIRAAGVVAPSAGVLARWREPRLPPPAHCSRHEVTQPGPARVNGNFPPPARLFPHHDISPGARFRSPAARFSRQEHVSPATSTQHPPPAPATQHPPPHQPPRRRLVDSSG
ncbi:MAG: hypothetical protein JWQ12_1917 [Glaciihabitans sp.]|nr:hypothetical protein [Glaciihabitans sp.]